MSINMCQLSESKSEGLLPDCSIGMEVIWSKDDTSRSTHDNLLPASISHLIYTMTDHDSRQLSQKWRPSKVDTVKPHFTIIW